MADQVYWAAKPPLEAAQDVYHRIDTYFQWVKLTGTYALWLRNLREYYAGFVTGGDLQEDGEQGELLKSKENHYHNIGQNIVVATTGSRPNFEPKAANSDHASMSQAIIAKGLLDAAMRDKDLEGIGVQIVTIAGLHCGEAYSTITWDPNLGREYAVNPDTSQVERTGDVKIRAYMPIDVARDHTKIRPDGHKWYAVRDWENRWDLATTRPELRDRILGLPGRWDEAVKRPTFARDWRGWMLSDSDDCAVWTFYHDKTPSLPDGRMMVLGAADLVLFDGPLPYDDLGAVIQRMAPEEMNGTQLGYTTAYDLLVPQREINGADTTITTSIANVGTGIIWTQPGGNVTVEQLEGGPKLIRSPVKPEPITLLDTQGLGTINEYKQGKIGAMEAISGVNSARRGTLVNDKAMSGAALALLDAKMIEYNKGLERGYVAWLESAATSIIKLYRRYAKLPQVAMVAGKANRSYLKEFTGNDLDRIERVNVDLANPLSRTSAGRMQITDYLLKMGAMTNPEQLVQVLQTGSMDSVLESGTAERMNIRAENEALGDGKPAQALWTDNHPKHIAEHGVVLASPEARTDQMVVANTLAHIQEHVNLWQTTAPDLLAGLGIPPPPTMTMGPPPGPGGAPGGPPPGHGGAPQDGPIAPENMPPGESLPQMPDNPGSGPQPSFPTPGIG